MGISRLIAIWADRIDVRTEAHPLAVQAYARWAGRFNRNRIPSGKGRPTRKQGRIRNTIAKVYCKNLENPSIPWIIGSRPKNIKMGAAIKAIRTYRRPPGPIRWEQYPPNPEKIKISVSTTVKLITGSPKIKMYFLIKKSFTNMKPAAANPNSAILITINDK